MEIISRAEAKALGLKRYFTGKPCKHGHVAELATVNGLCFECSSIKKKIRYHSDLEVSRKYVREKSKRRRVINPDASFLPVN